MDDQALAELLAKACPRPSFLASSNGGPVLSLALHCLMVDAGFVLASEAGRNAAPAGRYLPPKDWNGVYHDQWIFEYNKPGKARKFTLHCSLQARTGRMFVHCSEENNPNNTHVLGLQLENYVPSPAALKANSWRTLAPPPARQPTSSSPSSASPTSTAAAAPAAAGAPAPGAAGEAAAPGAAAAPGDTAAAGGDAAQAPSTVVVNAAKMQGMLTEHVLRPVLHNAEDVVGPETEEAHDEPQAWERGGGGSGTWLEGLAGAVDGGWRWFTTGVVAAEGEAVGLQPEVKAEFLLRRRRRRAAVVGAVGAAAAVALVVAVAVAHRNPRGPRGGRA